MPGANGRRWTAQSNWHLNRCWQNPHVPGALLHRELAGCYKIKLLKQGCRLIYVVEDDELVVLVLSVGKREDNVAYLAATKRIK